MLKKLKNTLLFAVEVKKAQKLPPPIRSQLIVKKLQTLGPTYTKLGQFLSSRSDIFDKDAIDALKTLQDKVDPIPWKQVSQIISDNLDPSIIDIDPTPIAAASIGQVHRGTIKKTGEQVVVKVKRPNIMLDMKSDIDFIALALSVFKKASKIAKIENSDKIDDLTRIVRDIESMLRKETDFIQEVKNMQLMSRSYPNVMIPRPFPEMCTDDVIVMTYVASTKLSTSPAASKPQLSYALMSMFIEQFLNGYGLHSDPHSGNVAYNQETKRFVFYDHGNILIISKSIQSLMKILVFELMTEDVDAVYEIVKKMPEIFEIRDESGMRSYIKKYITYVKTIDLTIFKTMDSDTLPVKFSPLVFEIIRVFGIVEGVCVSLDPTFKYDRVFLNYIDCLLIDRDFIDYKLNKDIGTLFKFL